MKTRTTFWPLLVLTLFALASCDKSEPKPEPPTAENAPIESLKKPDQTEPKGNLTFLRTDHVVVPPCDSFTPFEGYGVYHIIPLKGKAVTLYNAVTVATTIIPTQPTVKTHAWFWNGSGDYQEVSWFYSFAWSEDCSRQYDNMPVNHGNLNDLPVGFPVNVSIEGSPPNWHEVPKWDYFVFMIEASPL